MRTCPQVSAFCEVAAVDMSLPTMVSHSTFLVRVGTDSNAATPDRFENFPISNNCGK